MAATVALEMIGVAAGELLSQNDGAVLAEANEVDGVFADVDAETATVSLEW